VWRGRQVRAESERAHLHGQALEWQQDDPGMAEHAREAGECRWEAAWEEELLAEAGEWLTMWLPLAAMT